MANFELTIDSAHPKAKELLQNEFHWIFAEESGPFGNDDGSEAIQKFIKWRSKNKKENPVTFIKGLIKSWDFPPFDLKELDESKIENYISGKSSINDDEDLSNQLPILMDQFKKMAKDAGKDFDESQFEELLSETSQSMDDMYLVGIDNAIIATGFGQFVLEGSIENELKELTIIAINRELLPTLIERWEEDKVKRKEILNKMLTVLQSMNN